MGLMLQVSRSDKEETKLCAAFYARSFYQRLKGLIGKKSLPNDEGILFYPGGSIHTFGMRFPIDVIFLDKSGLILAHHKNIIPYRVCFAPIKTRYVLEVACNTLSEFKLERGQQLSWAKYER